MLLYTREDGKDDTGGFYGYRLTGVPWRAQRLESGLDEWVTFRLDAPMGTEPNTATFFDQAFTNPFAGQPTAADLLDTTMFDWSAWNPGSGMPTSIDYGAESIRFLSLQTGSNGDSTGCTDGLTVWHTDGRQLIIDLE